MRAGTAVRFHGEPLRFGQDMRAQDHGLVVRQGLDEEESRSGEVFAVLFGDDERAFEIMCRHANSRVAFGGPLEILSLDGLAQLRGARAQRILVHAVADGAVQFRTRLVRHAERARAEPGLDVFGGRSSQRDLEVVDDPRSVQCDRRNKPADRRRPTAGTPCPSRPASRR